MLIELAVIAIAAFIGHRLGRRNVVIVLHDIEVEAPARKQAEYLLDLAIRLKKSD
ncbi:hypothetical protein [Paraburkholderia antibiotica]|uniref:Uncharacterized protein n=1 Tax=Paraburkholderia antibiotica TaxID=2728839 RepID=A0A7Y0FGA2_9BURK|nr:hypothetical protein [Paraburkholderia antibiotica]NML34937.1 hypothetical protein [Paraburkholderia antibiotica]